MADQGAVGRQVAFQYLPVRSDQAEIRLLTIHPATELGAPLTCSLTSACLSAPLPQFEAVSYTWGDPALSHRLTVNGRPMAVTRAVFEVLQHLRATQADSPRIVWIDAVCIDQSSLAEN